MRRPMTESQMIFVTGSVVARTETVRDVEALSLEHVRRSRTEPGCLRHSVHRDVENEHRFVFLEYWQSREDLEQHFSLESSRAFVRSLRDLTSDASAIEIFEVTGVPGA